MVGFTRLNNVFLSGHFLSYFFPKRTYTEQAKRTYRPSQTDLQSKPNGPTEQAKRTADRRQAKRDINIYLFKKNIGTLFSVERLLTYMNTKSWKIKCTW
jgi:hypothetical protein